MTVNFTWKIVELKRQSPDNYVSTVHYSVDAQDGEHSTNTYGSVSLDRPKRLIKFEKLTEKKVIDWVKSALGEEQISRIQEALKNELEEQKASTTLSGLPW